MTDEFISGFTAGSSPTDGHQVAYFGDGLASYTFPSSEPLRIDIKCSCMLLRSSRAALDYSALALLKLILPTSILIHAPRWTISICPGGPHHRTILADLCPHCSIGVPPRACHPLVDHHQRGRHADLPEQLIYFHYRSIRSQSLRFFELGIPEHRGNSISVPTVKRTSLPTRVS